MFLEKTFLRKTKRKHTSSAMISTNKSNVLNKGGIEFFQSTDYLDSGANPNYYCSAPELRTMQLMSTNVKASHMSSKGEKTSSKIHFEMPLGATQLEFCKTRVYSITSHTCRALAKVKKKTSLPNACRGLGILTQIWQLLFWQGWHTTSI
jgi:hypothetical protein